MGISGISLAEKGWLPDAFLRIGIRRITRERLQAIADRSPEAAAARRSELVNTLNASPIAVATADANTQHYEVPPEFYRLCLGENLKYSCGFYEPEIAGLADAERAMLCLYGERARLEDGMDVMDLGCGWGSLSFWLAETYPAMQITAVSNSSGQKQFIDAEAQRRGLHNIRVITADINDFDTAQKFDRIMSIEMFEHMRNYGRLMAAIASWLKADGRLFVHIFCHRSDAYTYEVEDGNDWMARHFFTGGIMPAEDLLPGFDTDLVCEQQWWINGRHYSKTARDWLANLDANKPEALAVLSAGADAATGRLRFYRWRLFFLACEEFFAWDGGEEWGVAHYRFRRT